MYFPQAFELKQKDRYTYYIIQSLILFQQTAKMQRHFQTTYCSKHTHRCAQSLLTHAELQAAGQHCLVSPFLLGSSLWMRVSLCLAARLRHTCSTRTSR